MSKCSIRSDSTALYFSGRSDTHKNAESVGQLDVCGRQNCLRSQVFELLNLKSGKGIWSTVITPSYVSDEHMKIPLACNKDKCTD